MCFEITFHTAKPSQLARVLNHQTGRNKPPTWTDLEASPSHVGVRSTKYHVEEAAYSEPRTLD